jgi:hypothetical protein
MGPSAAEIFRVNDLNGVVMAEISVDELQRHLSSGSFTSQELTTWTIDRINQVSV